MTVNELIEKLQKQSPNAEVQIYVGGPLSGILDFGKVRQWEDGRVFIESERMTYWPDTETLR